MKLSASHNNFMLNVEFALAERERIAVVGPNAAGKSTLLAAWRDSSDAQLASAALGHPSSVLLEQRSLCFPHLTVLENVAFARRAQRLSKVDAHTHALRDLTAAGLADVASAYPSTLSGGQQQRVALLRALATRATTVLLDEPLSGLDVRAAREYRELLSERADSMSHVVIATHDPSDVLSLAERVLVLDNGALVADYTVEQLFHTPPNQFTAQLVDCNRIELERQVVWFAPQDARLFEQPADGSNSNVTVTSDEFRAVGRIESIDHLAHRDRLQVSIHPVRQGLHSAHPMARSEITVETNRDQSSTFRVGEACEIRVPVRAVRMAAE